MLCAPSDYLIVLVKFRAHSRYPIVTTFRRLSSFLKLTLGVLPTSLRSATYVSLVLMTIVAFSEIATIAILTRFLSSLADYSQPSASPKYLTLLGFTSFNGITIYSSFLAGVVLLSSAIKLASTWVNGRVSASIGSTIASICFKTAIYDSYQEHTNRHSSDLINRVNYIDGLVGGILQPTAQAISSVFLISATSMALLFIEPFITITTVAIVASLFFLLQRLIKRRLPYA